MRGYLFRGAAVVTALALAAPPALYAQTPDPVSQAEPAAPPQPAALADPAGQPEAAQFSTGQLDALLAPVALYPDALLMQVLMASTFPLQVVEESRWLNEIGHDRLQGDALAQALQPLPWDPSVKSLAPFPQVVAMLNGELEWMQQLGYAFATQQADVMSAVQRLRRQAQASGTLQSTEQQRVVEENDTIAIEPANPQVVYVPVYNPTIVYGAWPTPDYPPVYFPPQFGYAPDSAYLGGFGFATGVVVGSLFGFARPRWRHREVHIDVDRFNRINVNRAATHSEIWRAPPAALVRRPAAPPVGPFMGLPTGPATGPMVWGPSSAAMPANAMGMPRVQVPSWQMIRAAQPGFRQPEAQWTRPVQPVARPPVNQVRPMPPPARPPAAVQRPVAPQHGGSPRSGSIQRSASRAYAMH